ncbi:MAG: hypothetical protein IKU67_05900 [Firmicutes bacterium]|nr:hypothetical protein [Bacillota bacterium]
MKVLIRCFIILIFFVTATVALLRVDRQGALMYGLDNSISQTLQVFIENNIEKSLDFY